MDRVQHEEPAPRGRRLLLRLGLLAVCAGLLVLLSSRPADAAERREPQLLDPVGTTLKATAREVDSIAGRATGSGSSTVGRAANTARQAVAPPPRPTSGAARPATPSTVKRGAPAVTSPVRRVAPPTPPITPLARHTRRSAGTTANPVTRPATSLTGPFERTTSAAAGPLGRVAQVGGRALAPVGGALAPVGSVLDPVGPVLAPITGPVGGLVGPVVPGGLLGLPGLVGPGTGARAGPGAADPGTLFTGFEGTGSAAPAIASRTYPARPAADGASSPATRSIRSWPALTGAVSLPGFPTSAELPAGGPDPLSTSWGTGFGLVALAAFLLLLGPMSRGRTRPDRSGVISRSYLPLVSPA